MTLLSWKPDYNLGINTIDAEHMQIVDAMNSVYELDQKKADKAAIDTALRKLVDVTVKHFTDEERYMAKIEFPDRERHALIHKDMLKRIDEHYETFKQGNGSLTKEFYNFLTNWLTAHICHIDRKYARHPAPTA